jgi:cation:H+ antiporter
VIAVYLLALVLGLIALVKSADKFVDSASLVAKKLGMSPLLIGMIIVGFGTSAPEFVVSALASLEGNSGIALGNAYGSNITNIALILGATALFKPITVHSQVIKKELPLLALITVVSIFLIYDLDLSRLDAFIMLGIFAAIMFWTFLQNKNNANDSFAQEMESELEDVPTSMGRIYFILVASLVALVISSRALVFGAVGIAELFGVPDMIIGLTIVAIGTSLPEFASSIIAAKKGESDIAIGNVIGSNILNTLVVVGISGTIDPTKLATDFFYRDAMVVLGLTLSLFLLGYGFKKDGVITRTKGALLLISYFAYIGYLISTIQQAG